MAHALSHYLSNFSGLGDGEPGPISIIHPEDTPKVGTPGVIDCTLINCFNGKNFAPRFGLAWDVFGDHKTALRGGYGLYYQRISNQSLLQTSGGLPFQQTVSAAALSVSPQNPFPTHKALRPISTPACRSNTWDWPTAGDFSRKTGEAHPTTPRRLL